MIYETRWQFVEPAVTGRSVLDIGPAEMVGTVNRAKHDRWLHGRVALAASRLVGIDHSKDQVAVLQRLGYDIRRGDAEDFDLGERFEVVLAGEVIEHLSNPGRFLDCAREHLVDEGASTA